MQTLESYKMLCNWLQSLTTFFSPRWSQGLIELLNFGSLFFCIYTTGRNMKMCNKKWKRVYSPIGVSVIKYLMRWHEEESFLWFTILKMTGQGQPQNDLISSKDFIRDGITMEGGGGRERNAEKAREHRSWTCYNSVISRQSRDPMKSNAFLPKQLFQWPKNLPNALSPTLSLSKILRSYHFSTHESMELP